jgi:hypothetical protein
LGVSSAFWADSNLILQFPFPADLADGSVLVSVMEKGCWLVEEQTTSRTPISI